MRQFTMSFLVAALAAVPAFAQPISNAITYQGKLDSGGTPSNGSHDLQFQLFRTVGGNQQVGPTLCIDGVNIVDGLFTASLDFGNVFDGDERFLQVAVRADGTPGNCGGGTYTLLNPRQPIAAAPYALKVPGIDGNSLNAADGSPVDALFVDNVGNVGIGTITPQSKLHVRGVPEGIRVDGAAVGSANVAYMSFRDSSGVQRGYVGDGSTLDTNTFLSSDAGDVVLNTVAGRVLNATSTGNVGIGTTTPNSALHVRGNGNILSLEGSDHSLMGFYPDGVAAGRKGYLGYVSPANNDLHFVSEAVGSSLVFVPGTSGNIYVGNSAIPAPLVFPSVLGNKISLWGGAGGDHYGLGVQSGALRIYSNGAGANVAFGYGSSANFVEQMRIAGNGRVGIGTTSPQQMLDVNGTARVRVLEITGADLAEKFPTSDTVEPGMVVAIDPANTGKLCLARGAYNRCVAGVVSGANGFSVGAILGNLPGHEDAPPIALSGRVYVWCDAASGAIEPGDLLTTSDTPGHAMKASDRERSHGAVIGKAMERLESGRGLVLALVNLQ